MEPEQSDLLWLLILGFIIAFVLAFGIGANDVANSFGTSVGSKVLTLFQACIIASIFELAGAVLIGSKVSDTVRKGIIDINYFNGTEELAMAGAFSALTGTSIWLIIATFFNLPVSGTHSIVGATIGYALVAFSGKGITWTTFGKIAASWIISPLLSGLVSCLIFFGIDRLILKKESPLRNGLIALPFLFAGTMFINLFSILDNGKEVFGMAELEWYIILGMSLGISIFSAGLCFFFINPFLKRKILHDNEHIENSAKFESLDDDCKVQGTKYEKKNDEDMKGLLHDECEKENLQITVINSDDGAMDNKAAEVDQELNNSVKSNDTNGHVDKVDLLESGAKTKSGSFASARARSVSVLSEIMKPADDSARSKVQDDPHSAQLFKYLQILTAAFGAFAHGGNDVSNAIGPVISLWVIYQTGAVVGKTATPIWILLYGGVGIIVGLCVWGRRVIKTIGENLSPITPTSGFAIEIGAALTVLIASYLGIPISTTHCKVGSVVLVGRLRSKEVVDWSLFGNIVLSWVVTMPITGGISAAVFAVLREVI